MPTFISYSQALKKLEEYLIDSTTEGFPLEYLKIIKKEINWLTKENDRLEKGVETAEIIHDVETAEIIHDIMMDLGKNLADAEEHMNNVKDLCNEII